MRLFEGISGSPRRIFGRDLFGRDRRTQVHGRRFYVDRRDSLGLLTNPVFEPLETRVCQTLLQPGDRCLDVGANIGYYAVLLAQKVGASGCVTAIEPDPENHRLLQKNCAAEPSSSAVRIQRAALGARSGKASLYKHPANFGMHRLYESICCSGEATQVDVVTGDSLRLGPLDFIKIDIEGYESAALEGLSRTIEGSPRLAILAEFSPLTTREAGFLCRDLVERLLEHGLRPLAVRGEDWIAEDPRQLRRAAQIADRLDMGALVQATAGLPPGALEERACSILERSGYPRPPLENLLWVREPELRHTQSQLARTAPL